MDFYKNVIFKKPNSYKYNIDYWIGLESDDRKCGKSFIS